ncbi:DsbA family protein [Xinfangfangia sp. CPCC 101601]|uniref:DsbA family protein n=1 Tax=Pseudogemmobacter lacusdianii TaxID=3069608 RepID=A0ABU0VXD4_9RHOB|nr:DsbA family protein [Xinfangfangia sp. CPCC 101601]MDQ2066392.1 DsbA family protein [Xinfangfangia sp. CPCC 101601]
MNRRALIALAAAMAASPALGQEAAPEAAALPEVKDFSIGNPDAAVKIVEYASLTCPHCASFSEQTFKPLKAEFIDTGKVHFTLREVYFDRYGLWAAMMARCGGDLKYFPVVETLFASQSDWAASDDPTAAVAKIRKIGLTAGMTNEQLDACMQDAAMADAMVKRFEANMEADAVTGTPTLFINGERHGNMNYTDLKAIIDAKLAG